MARLPIPGGDAGSWGSILNDFLEQAHTSSGSLKTSALSEAGAALDSQVIHNTGDETIDGAKTFVVSPSIPNPTTSDQATTKSYVDSVVAAGASDATTTSKGIVQLAGDLTGTADSPQLGNSVIHDGNIDPAAGIAQSKIANLTSDLAAKANTADVLQQSNNLSDLNDAATARSNLGLGTASLSDAGDFESAGNLAAHINDPEDAHAATAIDVDASSLGLGSTNYNVQQAVDALAGRQLWYVRSLIPSESEYTIASDDGWVVLEFTRATTTTLNILPDSALNLPIGTVVKLFRKGAGDIALNPGGGVTILNETAGIAQLQQFATIDLRKNAANEWVLGELVSIGAGDGAADISFPEFDHTTPSIVAGGTHTESVIWEAAEDTVLIRQIRVEVTNPTAKVDVKILRQSDFSANGQVSNLAFHAQTISDAFMREFVWDYQDEDDSSSVHMWITNVSAVDTTVRVMFNKRIVQ